MTREDTIKVMSVLRGAYPHFYRYMTKAAALDVINLWAAMFAEDDANIVGAAVKAIIASDSSGFPPTIGKVKEMIAKLTQPQELTEGEAWALVAKAIRNSAYGSKEEFEKLPEDIQRIVGSPNQLRDWGQMDTDTVHSVVASNFQRSYKAKRIAAKEMAMLPGDVKTLIGGVAARMALEGGKHE